MRIFRLDRDLWAHIDPQARVSTIRVLEYSFCMLSQLYCDRWAWVLYFKYTAVILTLLVLFLYVVGYCVYPIPYVIITYVVFLSYIIMLCDLNCVNVLN